jgi:hypothetical protein
VILFVLWKNPAFLAVLSAGTAFFTTILSTPVRYFVDKRTLRHQLRMQYEAEQRRELKELIGRYHGRLVEAADNWHHRMENLYDYEAEGRLDAGRRYKDADYYFATTVYRFLALCSLARRFEAEAFFIDARIADPVDLDFAKFARAFRWLMTDLELVYAEEPKPNEKAKLLEVDGVPYNAQSGPDHFFTDRFRALCDACCVDGEVFTPVDFQARAGVDPRLQEALEFFDGLKRDEARLRWDRLICLHLLTMAFLNVAGYEIQHSSEEDFDGVAARLRHPEIRANLINGLARFGLADQPEVKLLVGRLETDKPTHKLARLAQTKT